MRTMRCSNCGRIVYIKRKMNGRWSDLCDICLLEWMMNVNQIANKQGYNMKEKWWEEKIDWKKIWEYAKKVVPKEFLPDED